MIRDRWRDIRAAIEQDIMDGVLEPGAKLPTEPELAGLYGAGRHSIRRAVAELAKEGYLSVEQGRGTFVHPRPMLDYTIGSRTRLRRNLTPQGVTVTGRTLDVERIPATERVAKRLGLDVGALVIASQRLSFANDVPVSLGTIYHDATRFPDFPERRQSLGSITAVYASYGITDYLRDSTRMYARPARVNEARQLHQHPDMPVIVVRAVDKDMDGTPLSYSEVIWSAARVKFNISTNEDAP
ncbi:MAG: phosphonate metabolism transcriptional regulator PhnF [Loktanella sp.]|nr:phosphonate metabolism transcriptional regulator PhnF [Loktanella sp.]